MPNKIIDVIEPEENEDVLELTDEAGDEGEEQANDNEEDREEVFVQIGDEEPEEVEPESSVLNTVRRELRETKKRLKELEAKPANAGDGVPEPGPRPKIEDYDYDQGAHDKAVDDWHEKRHAYAAAQEQNQTKQRRAEERWQAKVAKLEADKAALGLDDLEDLEENVRETLSVVQQGIVVQGAKNAALVFAALGRNPAKMRELSGIEDPVEFAFEIARMETQLKTGRRQVPPPEGGIKVRTKSADIASNTLEKLRAKAERTGDYSEVMAYKRQQRREAAK